MNVEELLASGLEEAKVQLFLVVPDQVHPTPATSTMPLKFNPNEIKVKTWGAPVGVAVSHLPDPQDWPAGSVSIISWQWHCQSNRRLEGSEITVKLTIHSRQAQTEVVPSASAWIIKALKEPLRDRKKQKKTKTLSTVEITTFDEIVNIAWLIRHRSLIGELSETIKEILGSAQSVGCSVDGHHPPDISSGAVEWTTDKNISVKDHLTTEKRKKECGVSWRSHTSFKPSIPTWV